MGTLLCFLFFAFLHCFFCPFCFPAISFTQQISMDPAQLATSQFPACFDVSHLHLNLLLYGSTFLVKSISSTRRHCLSRILPRTHCSSKYCISVSEKCGLLLSAHLTTFLSSCLSRNSNGKRLNGSYSGIIAFSS